MRFDHDTRKTAQAASYLLSRNNGAMNYMALIKLLYLADRQSLIETGAPITGDRLVVMPFGPVLSSTLNSINMGEPLGGSRSDWYQYISEPDGYTVKAKTTGEFETLSPYEKRVLDGIYAEFGKMDRWALVEYTHKLPEWSDPNGSSFPIDVEVILRSAGRSDEEIEAISQEAESVWLIRSLGKTRSWS